MDEANTARARHSAPPTVAAVFVAHNGAAWLPKVLTSLARLRHAPTSWNVVDVASTDGSSEFLREAFGRERIIYAPTGTGFGDAVRLALADQPRTDWIWLLHDDCAVDPDALAGLLEEAASAADIAVVGPKIREWPSLRTLVEVGLTVSNTGGRETQLEPGEPDAGQYDRPRDVLAVNTAGMLVRRDVWDELGGLDPALPLYFDDIDFGWRVARAGYRTRLAPRSVVFHAEASHRGSRRRTSGDSPPWHRRRGALYAKLVNADPGRFVWQYIRLFFGSLLRVLGFLLSKDPESASDELLALRDVYGHPRSLLSSRRRRAHSVRRKRGSFKGLFPPFWVPYRHGFDDFRDAVNAMVRPETVLTTGRRASRRDEAGFDDFEEPPSLVRRRPWLAVVLCLGLLAVAAGRGLWGASLHGGALLPAPDTAGGWWSLVFGGSREVGFAVDGFISNYVFLLAVFSTPVWFSPGVLITVLMLFAVPLAALTAHRLGRLLTSHRAFRMVWAVTYGLCVAGVGAVNQGRFGTVVALVVLPILINAGLQLATHPTWRSGLRLGLWISVAAAFAPVMYALSFIILVAVSVIQRRTAVAHVVALLTPVVLLGPTLAWRLAHPIQLFWEAGLPIPGVAEAWQIVLGQAGGPGAAPVWLNGGIVFLGLGALIFGRDRAAITAAWALGLVGLLSALFGTTVALTAGPQSVALEPWVGIGSVLWIFGLTTAALLAAADAMRAPRVIGVVLAALALLVPVVGTGWWLVQGQDDPLRQGDRAVIPAFLVERPGTTLVLTGNIDDGVDFRMIHGAGPFLGQETLIPTRHAARQLTSVVQHLVTESSMDGVQRLAQHGVSAIYAPDVDPELAQRLDATGSLAPAGSDRPSSRVWTLTIPPELHGSGTRASQTIAGVWTFLAWSTALVLIAPVRRRRLTYADRPAEEL